MNVNPSAKRVLCFGDSNTRGFVPGSAGKERYPLDVRWTGRLQTHLGQGYEVIEEGLDGRLTVYDDPRPGFFGKNAKPYIAPCLQSHQPLDLVVLMLGTPDLKEMMNLSAKEITKGVSEIANIVLSSGTGRSGGAPKLLVMVPAPIIDTTPFSQTLFKGGSLKSKELSPLYRELASKLGAMFIDAGEVARVDEREGIHLTPESHASLALCVAEEIRKSGI